MVHTTHHYICGRWEFGVMMLCLVAVRTAAQPVCHDVLKVALFRTAFRACLEPVGRPLWREGPMGEGRR